MSRIGVLGAGTWGMALIRMLSRSGHDVQVPEEIDQLSTTGGKKSPGHGYSGRS